MAKTKTIWVCSECGNESPKWVGKCSNCNSWDTYYEEKESNIKARDDKSFLDINGNMPEVIKLSEAIKNTYVRMSSGYEEVNRVLRRTDL